MTADVIVVGAGIVGVATALALAEHGADVEVIERYRPAAMASGWTLAGVRQSGRHAAELELARAAVAIWRTLDDRLEADTGYRQGGNLRLARTPAEAEVITRLVDDQRAAGLDIELLDPAGIRAVAPCLSRDIALASFCASDGHADPVATVEAFRAAAERRGVRFRLGTAVLSVATGPGPRGRRFRSLTTSGGTVAGGTCLLAAGIQTNDLLVDLGLSLPMTTPLVAVIQTAPLPAALAPVIGVANADLAVRQQVDGRFRFTSGAEPSPPNLVEVDGRPAVHPSAAAVAGTIGRVAGVLPMIADAPVARIWGGLLDLTPDALPVLDRVPGIDGLVVAAGFSGHGFGIAPAVARALAELVLDRRPALALDAFRFDRFADADAAGSAASLSLHG